MQVTLQDIWDTPIKEVNEMLIKMNSGINDDLTNRLTLAKLYADSNQLIDANLFYLPKFPILIQTFSLGNVRKMLEPQLLISNMFNDLNLTTVVDSFLDYKLIEIARLKYDFTVIGNIVSYIFGITKIFNNKFDMFTKQHPELAHFNLVCFPANNTNSILSKEFIHKSDFQKIYGALMVDRKIIDKIVTVTSNDGTLKDYYTDKEVYNLVKTLGNGIVCCRESHMGSILNIYLDLMLHNVVTGKFNIRGVIWYKYYNRMNNTELMLLYFDLQ